MADTKRKLIDLTGQVFGRLTILYEVERRRKTSGKPYRRWLCRCDCEKTLVARHCDLTSGNTQSCGCLQIDRLPRTHGMSKTLIYATWQRMRYRCYDPKHPDYYLYGKRGITVCAGLDTFEQFYAEMGDKPKPNLSIDRIKNHLGYWCGHCDECVTFQRERNVRWGTVIEQANNKRSNHLLTLNNDTHTIAEWSRILNVSYNSLSTRVSRGWSDERALTTPLPLK